MDQIGWGAQHPQFAVFLAILVAALSGAVFSMLLAFASVHLKANQTIGGTALNMLAPAFAIVLTWAIQGQGQTTIAIPKWVRITSEASQEVFFNRLIFKSLYLTTPIAILLLIASVIILYKTRLGLRLRSCGEHPQAADSVGINVYKMRYIGVCLGLFPVIGLALPFFSYGGSSLMTSFMAAGIVSGIRMRPAPDISAHYIRPY